MATYREIQEWVKSQSGFVPKTCWIADIKNDYGLIGQDAPNRRDPNLRTHPCPASKRSAVEEALRHFEMI